MTITPVGFDQEFLIWEAVLTAVVTTKWIVHPSATMAATICISAARVCASVIKNNSKP
jgi:hypothetical protein